MIENKGVRLYSGSKSVEFWNRVKACTNREIYVMSCILQDVESRVLASLEEDERVRSLTKKSTIKKRKLK